MVTCRLCKFRLFESEAEPGKYGRWICKDRVACERRSNLTR